MANTGDKQIALIADDDEFFRMALSTVLRNHLHFVEVIEAGSFAEAVDALERIQHVSLAMFDLAMPGLACPSALRKVRDSDAVERLVVVSGSKQRRDILLSLEAGAHGFICKDQGVGELETALRQILEGGMYVPTTLADLKARAGGHEENGALDAGDAEKGYAPNGSADESWTRPTKPAAPRLTPRQEDVLALVVEGKSNKEIARELNLGPGTIKVHLAALFRNLGVPNRAAAAVAGARLLQSPATTSRPLRNRSADAPFVAQRAG